MYLSSFKYPTLISRCIFKNPNLFVAYQRRIFCRTTLARILFCIYKKSSLGCLCIRDDSHRSHVHIHWYLYWVQKMIMVKKRFDNVYFGCSTDMHIYIIYKMSCNLLLLPLLSPQTPLPPLNSVKWSPGTPKTYWKNTTWKSEWPSWGLNAMTLRATKRLNGLLHYLPRSQYIGNISTEWELEQGDNITRQPRTNVSIYQTVDFTNLY